VSDGHRWVIDASMSDPSKDWWCFVPFEDDAIIFGMSVLSGDPPGLVIAVVHEGGQDACDAFCREHSEAVERVISRSREVQP
jgi:hypothetical protein